ncbi:MAG: exo-alpha-sialidase, partial [Ignavibacteriae bacterium]|nr:exo-alpha-sialidase [Ignavibacteriota bacterium]
MKNSFIFFSAMVFIAVLFLKNIDYKTIDQHEELRVKSTSSPHSGIKAKKGRQEYFDRLLKDPVTKKIPSNIREMELKFADELNKKNKSLYKTSQVDELVWQEAGPNNVGGRTRALAVDVSNSNTILAGGTSGGIWKSTDKGATWVMKSTTSQVLSVSSIAQDPRSGQTNTWYYSSGELLGSGSDQGSTHSFSGGGIYKSSDNGETWSLLPNAKDTDPLQWNTPFDFVSKIIVNPATGSVFIASHAFGILRSNNGGSSFELVLGGANHHIFSDVDVTPNGTVIAVISSPFSGVTATNSPGVYKSANDGANWTNMTPTTLPADHQRSVIEAANNNTAYVLTFTGNLLTGDKDDVRFHKINITTGTSVDRSANMPDFNNDFEDYIHTQNSYNLTLAAKPDDENFVLIAGTSLFRSTNGFSTKPSNQKLDWIGGYHTVNFFYPNFHPDIHSFAFDPNNSNIMWWGNDGGLSYTSNISTNSYNTYFPWESKNNGYNVTQFYMVAINDNANDERIIGGTQDNGSPFFRYNGSSIANSSDVTTGDGSYAYLGNDYCYGSVQNGVVLRVNYDGSGTPSRSNGWSNITPQNASNQLFINPYAVDPSDENIMYYPAGNKLWRNNQLNSLPSNQSFDNGLTTGWNDLTNLSAPASYVISALSVSKTLPQHRLYYAAVDFAQTPSSPKLYRLDNAHTSTSGAVDISIAGLDGTSYIHNIAINPENADEILVIISNYNVKGIYHSLNGGNTFTQVEGNLEGDAQNPGPSIRGASILPTSSGTQYFVGTSTGIYSTLNLNGNSTIWVQEGSNTIGNVIVNYITSRKSDGRIVAGTHGRGVFVSNANVGGTAVANVNVSNITLQSRPGETGSTSFTLSNNGQATLNYNISVTGSFGNALPKSVKPEYTITTADLNSRKYDEFRNKSNFNKTKMNAGKINKVGQNSAMYKVEGDDYLILDDGDSNVDSFVGWGNGNDFDWYNEFNVSGYDFTLDSFEFYMRTESASSNNVYVAVFDQNFDLISEGTLNLNLASQGSWYGVTVDPAINLSNGETFYIELYSYSFIPYPAGTDTDAQITNKSFYYNGADWVNLNTITGFENGAFLIRASGTKNGSTENLITVEPASGNIAPGSSQTITLTLNAQNLGEGTYTGQVTITTNGGNLTIPINYLVDVEKNSETPSAYKLSQNYPNPFNPSTKIKYTIKSNMKSEKSKVSLIIYDILGKVVKTLVNEN